MSISDADVEADRARRVDNLSSHAKTQYDRIVQARQELARLADEAKKWELYGQQAEVEYNSTCDTLEEAEAELDEVRRKIRRKKRAVRQSFLTPAIAPAPSVLTLTQVEPDADPSGSVAGSSSADPGESGIHPEDLGRLTKILSKGGRKTSAAASAVVAEAGVQAA